MCFKTRCGSIVFFGISHFALALHILPTITYKSLQYPTITYNTLQCPISPETFKKRCQTVGATPSMDPDLPKLDLDCWTPQISPAVLPYNPEFWS